MCVTLQTADCKLACVQRVDENAEVWIGVIAYNRRLVLFGCIDERSELCLENFTVAAMHVNVMRRQEIVLVTNVLTFAPVSCQGRFEESRAKVQHHLSHA